jgi:signal transduction histidine kinase
MVSGQTSVGSCHSCHEPESGGRVNDVLAFAPLARVPWGVALRQSESEVFAAAQTLTNEFWVLGLVVFVAFGAIIWMSTREFVWPLEAISRACKRVAAGKLDQPVQLSGSAEAVTLGESFDSMRRDLLSYRQHIEHSQQELEDRVQGRTRELVLARDHLLRTNRNLGALNAVAAILSQSLNLSDTLESALRRALDAVSADTGLIYLSAPDGGMNLAASRGVPAESLGELVSLPQSQAGGDANTSATPMPAPKHGLTSACQERLAAGLHITNLLSAPLNAKGETLGAICVGDRPDRPFGQDDQALLDSIATQIALAVRNARLYDALQQEEKARGDLLRQVIVAQEDERKRVARELHDETSQATTALMVGLDTVGLALTHNPADAAARLAATRHIAAGMLQNVQRLISDLRPSLLDDLGLVPAIAWYGDQRLGPSGISVTIEHQGMDRRLPQAVETAVFRIAQEAFTNIMRHSGAARVRVAVSLSAGYLTLEVADDGQGMPADALRSEFGSGQRMGLRGMRERVNILGGEFRVRSSRETGTVLTVRIPIRG